VVFEILPSKNFSPPPITLTTTTRSYPHAMRRLCVGSESDLRRPRFVAVTTYRCRVRFRRPNNNINKNTNKDREGVKGVNILSVGVGL